MSELIELKDVSNRLRKDFPDWPEEKVERAIDQYIKHWKLCKRYSDLTIVPTPLADEVWHRHLLFTKKYADDCNHVFGYFLHHEPFREHTSEARIEATVNETRTLYEKHFGAWPADPVAKAACPGGDCGKGDPDPHPKCEHPTCANVRG